MNRLKSYYKQLTWLFMGFLLTVFAAGCGSWRDGSGLAQGPAAVDLGTAGTFVILAKTGVSTTGVTKVTGNIGVSPAGEA